MRGGGAGKFKLPLKTLIFPQEYFTKYAGIPEVFKTFVFERIFCIQVTIKCINDMY